MSCPRVRHLHSAIQQQRGIHHVGVQRQPSAAAQDVQRSRQARCRAVRAWRGHGLDDVGHGQNACLEQDFVSLESGWIACAVQTFVVLTGDFLERPGPLDASQDVNGGLSVLLDDFELLGSKRGGLGQQIDGHTDLANVVHDGSQVQHMAALRAQTQVGGQIDGNFGHATLMSHGVGIALGQGARKRLDDLLEHVLQMTGRGRGFLGVRVFTRIGWHGQLDGQEPQTTCALLPATQPMRPTDALTCLDVQAH